MNGTKVVLDSNVIILASKEKIDVGRMLSKYDLFYASLITYIEVYAYDFQNFDKKHLIDNIFANLEIIEPSKEIADQAVIYHKNKFKKIKLPDAIILATAKRANADLLTDDWKDFLDIDSFVNVINLDDLKI